MILEGLGSARVPMHANQLTVPVDAVRALVDEQFPAWRSLRITDGPAHPGPHPGGRIAAGAVVRWVDAVHRRREGDPRR